MEYLYAVLLLMGGLGAFLMGASIVSENIGKCNSWRKKKRVWQNVFWIEPLMSIWIFWEMKPCNYTLSEKMKVHGLLHNSSIITSFLLFLKNVYLKKILFYWRIVDLQGCVDFCCTVKWFSYTYIYTYTIFHILFHYGLSQVFGYSSPCSPVGPCCLSIL